MKILFTIISIWTLTELRAQTSDIIGIFQLDRGSSPSRQYLLLDCDSTYHFISHWDYGGKKEVAPIMTDKRKWKIENEKTLILDNPIYPKYKSFDLLPNGKLYLKYKGGKETWFKIGTIDKDCTITSFIVNFKPDNYTIAKLNSGHKMRFSEAYTNGLLRERITYYEMSDSEFKDFNGNAKSPTHDTNDIIMELIYKIGLYEEVWPKEKIEQWDNGQLTVKYFDKFGQEISKD